MQKFSLLNFKRSLLIFFMMFLIITPIISFSKEKLEINMVMRLPIFEEEKYNLQEMFQRFLFPRQKSPSEILLEKVDRLNDIFLEGEFLKGLRNFIITI